MMTLTEALNIASHKKRRLERFRAMAALILFFGGVGIGLTIRSLVIDPRNVRAGDSLIFDSAKPAG